MLQPSHGVAEVISTSTETERESALLGVTLGTATHSPARTSTGGERTVATATSRGERML